MEIIFTLSAILQSVAISLGVGCSTLAILNFFSAIADGTIDETERRMMGVVYVVLRVAMVLILVTTFILGIITYIETSSIAFPPYVGALWTLMAVLYTNAILMTLRVVPSTVGPSIQASSWYTLGGVTALSGIGLTSFNYGQFFLGYLAMFLLFTAIVNGYMAYVKQKKQ